MNKKKYVTIIGIMLLLLPEILFSTISNIFYGIFIKPNHGIYRSNFLFNSDISIFYLNVALLLQLIGSILLSYQLLKSETKKGKVLGILCILLVLLVLFLGAIVNVTNTLSF